MNDVLAKILLHLAVSDEPERHIKDALTQLRRVPEDAVLAKIAALRREARSGFHSRSISDDLDKVADDRSEQSVSFIDDVIVLLQKQARLSTSEVSQALSKTLLGSSKALPLRNKEGLRRWLQRLSTKRDPRLILSEATRIRNTIVHADKSGWTFDDVRAHS